MTFIKNYLSIRVSCNCGCLQYLWERWQLIRRCFFTTVIWFPILVIVYGFFLLNRVFSFRFCIQATAPTCMAARPDCRNGPANLLHNRHRLHSGGRCTSLLLRRSARACYRLHGLYEIRNDRQVCRFDSSLARVDLRVPHWFQPRKGFYGQGISLLWPEQLLSEPSTVREVAWRRSAARSVGRSVVGLCTICVRREWSNDCTMRSDRQLALQRYSEHPENGHQGGGAVVTHRHCMAVGSSDKVPQSGWWFAKRYMIMDLKDVFIFLLFYSSRILRSTEGMDAGIVAIGRGESFKQRISSECYIWAWLCKS